MMPFAAVGGQHLFYVEQGAGDPLLLVTGLGGDHLSWGEQLGPFAERFRTIAFDNRDSGQSSASPEAYEIPDMAQDGLGLADHLGLDDFHLMGISMGGAIAQELALAAPERVRTLTLAMSWPGDGHVGPVRGRLMANAAMRTPREEHIEQLLLACLSEEAFEDPERVAYFRRMVLGNPHPQSVEGFARQAQAVSGHEARDRLGRLEMPTHVIGAERDLMFPVWKARELAALIPGARFTMLERGTHAVNMEQAEEFNRVVLAFLDEASAERRAA
jgi:Predicted hydrolases or acyltransferases (alpha/beta hydrolase superfamily)